MPKRSGNLSLSSGKQNLLLSIPEFDPEPLRTRIVGNISGSLLEFGTARCGSGDIITIKITFPPYSKILNLVRKLFVGKS